MRIAREQPITFFIMKVKNMSKSEMTGDPEDFDVRFLDIINELGKDLAEAAKTMGADEARFLVDAFYAMQLRRIAASGQVRALSKTYEPHKVLKWYNEQAVNLEKHVHKALHMFAKTDPFGEWLLSIVGIGPILSAGLLAHVDWTVSHAYQIWCFAGLVPGQKWEKGKKRPWNANLRTLTAFKTGESFVKFQNHSRDVYGHLFRNRKHEEIHRNLRGDLSEDATKKLKEANIRPSTDAYKWYSGAVSHEAAHRTFGKILDGEVTTLLTKSDLGCDGISMLPPAHIHARARRWAVKLFLSHAHAVGHFIRTKRIPEPPYIIVNGEKHRHITEPPNADSVRGFRAAWEKNLDMMRKKGMID